MLSSSLSTIVIFIPFALMSGVAGAYFKVLAATMVITLLCSFFCKLDRGSHYLFAFTTSETANCG
jgi:multidrug efflux pump subunit AcrB